MIQHEIKKTLSQDTKRWSQQEPIDGLLSNAFVKDSHNRILSVLINRAKYNITDEQCSLIVSVFYYMLKTWSTSQVHEKITNYIQSSDVMSTMVSVNMSSSDKSELIKLVTCLQYCQTLFDTGQLTKTDTDDTSITSLLSSALSILNNIILCQK